MLSRRDITHTGPSPRRQSRTSSTSTKQVSRAMNNPLAGTSPNHPHPLPAEHRYSQSMSFSPSSAASTRANTAASRIITTVRRSFTHKKRQLEAESSNSGMYSTPEEQNRRFASRFRFQDVAATPPTVEQIAMGLHVSRTPHLRAVGQHQRIPCSASDVSHPSAGGITSRVHPPPPTRSSIKKSGTPTISSTMTPATTPGLSAASMSTTTITSVTPSIAKSTRSLTSLKTRMTRFLPGARSLSVPLPRSDSETSSTGENRLDSPRRKAVRFTSSTVGLDEKTHRIQE